jgi:hypothetical protein
MKYLGIPKDGKRMVSSRWNPVVEKMGKKLNPRQGKNLVMAG